MLASAGRELGAGVAEGGGARGAEEGAEAAGGYHPFTLDNPHALCYATSVVQAIYHVPPVREALLELPEALPPGPEREARVARAAGWRASKGATRAGSGAVDVLARIFDPRGVPGVRERKVAPLGGESEGWVPRRLFAGRVAELVADAVPGFSGQVAVQEDAAEFLYALLEDLCQRMPRVRDRVGSPAAYWTPAQQALPGAEAQLQRSGLAEEPALMEEAFVGQETSTAVCNACGTSVESNQPLASVSVALSAETTEEVADESEGTLRIRCAAFYPGRKDEDVELEAGAEEDWESVVARLAQKKIFAGAFSPAILLAAIVRAPGDGRGWLLRAILDDRAKPRAVKGPLAACESFRPSTERALGMTGEVAQLVLVGQQTMASASGLRPAVLGAPILMAVEPTRDSLAHLYRLVGFRVKSVLQECFPARVGPKFKGLAELRARAASCDGDPRWPFVLRLLGPTSAPDGEKLELAGGSAASFASEEAWRAAASEALELSLPAGRQRTPTLAEVMQGPRAPTWAAAAMEGDVPLVLLIHWTLDGESAPRRARLQCQLRKLGGAQREEALREGDEAGAVPMAPQKRLVDGRAAEKEASAPLVLEELLRAWTAETVMDGENAYACSSKLCNGTRGTARVAQRVTFFPRILVLQLKRFGRGRTGGPLRKDSRDVRIPLAGLKAGELLGGDGAGEGLEYNLAACISHCGTMFQGHYRAACTANAGPDSEWTLFDDGRASQLGRATGSEAVFRSAYILFYTLDSRAASST